MNILFVCTGNTCRSPMAEALLRSKKGPVQVRSAGIFAGYGQPMSEGSQQVLSELDLEVNHFSTPLDAHMLQWADLVLTMTDRHKETLTVEYPQVQGKVFTLKEYVRVEDEQWEKLKKLYAAFEEKRLLVMKQAKADMTNDEIDQLLRTELSNEIRQIQEVEASLPDIDISDPFGGSVNTYRATRKELEAQIDLLVKKLDQDT